MIIGCLLHWKLDIRTAPVPILNAAIFLALIDIVLYNFGEDTGDLLFQKHFQFLLHIFGQTILVAEFFCESFCGITLIYNYALHALLSDVDVDVEFWILILQGCHWVWRIRLIRWILRLMQRRRRWLWLPSRVLLVWHVLPELLLDEQARVVKVVQRFLYLRLHVDVPRRGSIVASRIKRVTDPLADGP